MLIASLRILCFLLSLRFLPIKKQKIADRLKRLGPTFIKFGQSCSSRPDIFGTEITNSLLTLCDQLDPFTFTEVKKIVEGELNDKIENLFPYFEEKPISAASIAQVHKACTSEGRLVAVKVLRPGITKQFNRDIKVFKLCIKLLKPFLPKRFKLNEAIKLFADNVKFELDLRFEAANAAELSESMSSIQEIIIPEVIWKSTSTKVLTMEWVDGVAISKYDNNYKVAENLATLFVKQAYYHGIFHGDLHSGNILITEDERIALVDFGIVGRLTAKDKIYVAEILLGFLKRDYNHVAELHFRAGYVSSQHCNFAMACRAIGEPMINKGISVAELLGQLFKITADFNISIQPQLLLLQKAMLLVEGHCLRISPGINLSEVIKPHMETWARENLGLKRKLCNTQVAHKLTLILDKLDKCLSKDNTQSTSNSNVWYIIIALGVYFALFALVEWLLIS